METSLKPAEFVSHSLGLNLFFLRIMKEHSLFLEAGFVCSDKAFIDKAERFKNDLNNLLKKTVDLANGNISQPVVNSGEVATNRTMDAEKATEDLSGIAIDTSLTAMELELQPGTGNPDLKDEVSNLNERAMGLTRSLAEFKSEILDDVLACNLFTFNFPLLIEHIRREALFFVQHLERLQTGEVMNPVQEMLMEKSFWDRIMAEHALFIAHYLDPTETALIKKAEAFATRFAGLEQRVKRQQRQKNNTGLRALMADEIKATQDIKNFKTTGEELILACKVRSLIIPLLADHVVREADHFLRIQTEMKMPTAASTPKSGTRTKRRFRN